MSTTDIARAIVAALQPLQGPAASGSLLVHATGGDVALGSGAIAVPLVGGALVWPGAVFTTGNSAAADRRWTVTASGTVVAVEALQGGPAGNIDAAVPYRWFPQLGGIEETSASSVELTGGAFVDGGLRQIVLYKDLSKADVQTFFRAQLYDCPAVALSWESTQPLDGPMAAAPSPRAARVGRGKLLFRHTWLLWVVTSRLDGDAERTQEGDELRDAVIGRLLDLTSARSNCLRVSSDPGATILDCRVAAVTPTSYVDLIRFATSGAIERVDEAVYNNWLKTRIKVSTAAQAPDPPIDLPDVTVPMT